MARPWRVANSLLTLRDQLNARYPNRSKTSDGTIGDAAHSSRASDHNAHIIDGGHGVVSALDITHDPRSGCDAHAIAEALRLQRDGRIKYIISARRICSSTKEPWVWRRYTGSNPHTSHIHISVKPAKAHYDATHQWVIAGTPDAEGKRPVLRRSSRGPYVEELQRLLGIRVDGEFGEVTFKAVIDFQRAFALAVDGIVGPETWEWLLRREPDPDSPTHRRTLRRGDKGDDVREVQRLLDVDADGDFGALTEVAVKSFQRSAGLKDDGIVGPLTWRELDTVENSYDGEPLAEP